MGEVYRARDTKLDREVAVKVLPQSLAADADALARFEREAKAVASLSHPNILSIFDFGTHEGRAYAVTELLEGETLRERLSEGAIPPRKAAEIAQAVGLGLAAAHDRGIVHRDLKPENLFLTTDGRAKILDFGLAREISRPSSEDTHSPTVAPATEPGTVLGTVGYMSPEQVRGQPADHRSDLFSLGAVLYEMLSGNRAFRGETAVETMNAILKEDPPGLSQLSQHVSPGLGRIVSHCLEKRAEERFQSARDLAFDLGSLTAESGAQPGGVANRPRRRLARVLGATGALLAVALLGTLVGRRTAPRPEPPRYERLTFRRGSIMGARFTPDGQSVVYSAAWGEAPAELYVTRMGQPEARPLGIRNANLLSVSRGGEVAVLLSKKDLYGGEFITGMLARAAIEGGVPREVAGNINEADFSPDGSDFAVGRFRGARAVLEFPIGHLVAESPDVVSFGPRISPDGRSVAFAFYQNGRASIRTADRSGKTRTLADGFVKIDHVCWHPSGREVWFNETDLKGRNGIDAVTLDGRVRTVATGAALYLRDIAPDGRVLLSSVSTQHSILFGRAGNGEKPRDLSWLDGSGWPNLSADGARMVFTEVGESEGLLGGSIYVRNTDGGPAVRLGKGFADDISPDGQWILGRVHDSSGDHISLIPVGAGSPRVVTAGRFACWLPGSFPTGERSSPPEWTPMGRSTSMCSTPMAGPAGRDGSHHGKARETTPTARLRLTARRGLRRGRLEPDHFPSGRFRARASGTERRLRPDSVALGREVAAGLAARGVSGSHHALRRRHRRATSLEGACSARSHGLQGDHQRLCFARRLRLRLQLPARPESELVPRRGDALEPASSDRPQLDPLRKTMRFQKLVAGGEELRSGPQPRQFPQPSSEKVPTGNYVGSH